MTGLNGDFGGLTTTWFFLKEGLSNGLDDLVGLEEVDGVDGDEGVDGLVGLEGVDDLVDLFDFVGLEGGGGGEDLEEDGGEGSGLEEGGGGSGLDDEGGGTGLGEEGRAGLDDEGRGGLDDDGGGTGLEDEGGGAGLDEGEGVALFLTGVFPLASCFFEEVDEFFRWTHLTNIHRRTTTITTITTMPIQINIWINTLKGLSSGIFTTYWSAISVETLYFTPSNLLEYSLATYPVKPPITPR